RSRRVLIRKDAVERVRRENGHRSAEQSDARKGLWQTEAFVVEKEEEFVFDDRASQPSAVLIEEYPIAIQPADVVEIAIRIERRIGLLPEDSAVIFICAGFCDELDLHRDFAAAFGAGRRG